MTRWQERPVYVAGSNTFFEPFVPPEGDGKASLLSKEVTKEK